MLLRLAVTGLIAASLVACSHNSGPVPLSGVPADLDALQGRWSGTYHAYERASRSGTIYFRLEAGQDTARGDVLMHPGGRELAEAAPYHDPWSTAAPGRILTITFVRAADSTVFGRLDPYPDPICGCERRTMFTGRITGDVIEGTYTSENVSGGDRNTGRWRVTRSGP
jgi:hypothetical protein